MRQPNQSLLNFFHYLLSEDCVSFSVITETLSLGTWLALLVHVFVLSTGGRRPRRGDIMSQRATVSARILDMVSQAPGCQLDELLSVSSDLTWNQAFLAIDHVTRTGGLRLRAAGPGRYTVWLSESSCRDRPFGDHGRLA